MSSLTFEQLQDLDETGFEVVLAAPLHEPEVLAGQELDWSNDLDANEVSGEVRRILNALMDERWITLLSPWSFNLSDVAVSGALVEGFRQPQAYNVWCCPKYSLTFTIYQNARSPPPKSSHHSYFQLLVLQLSFYSSNSHPVFT